MHTYLTKDYYIFVINTVFAGNKIVSDKYIWGESAPIFVFGNGTK